VAKDTEFKVGQFDASGDFDAVEQFQSGPGVDGAEITDPIQAFQTGVQAGGLNLVANLEYFNAIGNSIMGEQKARDRAIARAQNLQQDSASLMADFESFENFLEEPTVGGFINQVFSATGQFAPSAAASMAAALTGAGVGALIGGVALKAGGQSALTSLATKRVAQKEIKNIVNKKLRNETLDEAEEGLLNATYDKLRKDYFNRQIGRGAIAGAVAQEYPQGAGIAFGTFAEQDMVDPVQAFQSLGLGVPFAAVGVGSEALIANNFRKILMKGKGPLHNQILQSIGVSATAEGVTEALQEELTVQQRFAIDDDYEQAHANLDRAQALFAGFFGGAGVGAAGGTVASVIGKAREGVNEGYVAQIEKNFESERFGNTEDGKVAPEPKGWLLAQMRAMVDPSNKKDSVFIDANSYQQAQELQNDPRYADLFAQAGAKFVDGGRMGTLLSSNEESLARFADLVKNNPNDTLALDALLVDILGFTNNRNVGQDTSVVEVSDLDGNLIWYQTVDQETKAAAERKARELFGNEARVESVSISDHVLKRKQKVQEEKMGRTRGSGAFTLQEGLDEVRQDQAAAMEQEDPSAIFANLPEPGIAESTPPIRASLRSLGRKVEGRTREVIPFEVQMPEGEGWAVGKKTNLKFIEEEVINKAKGFFPEFKSLNDQLNANLEAGRYSNALLNTYNEISEKFPSNLYTITEFENNVGETRYQIQELKTQDLDTMLPALIPTKVQQALEIESNIENNIQQAREKNIPIEKGKRTTLTGFKIKTPGSNQFRPVYMPVLTSFGRKLNAALRMETANPKEQTEQEQIRDGFGTIYFYLTDQGYEFTWPGKDNFNTSLEKSNAIVYADKGKNLSLKALQPGKFGVPGIVGKALTREEKFNNLKKQIREAFEVGRYDRQPFDLATLEEQFTDPEQLEELEDFVEEVINPQIPSVAAKITTPSRLEAGEFLEAEADTQAETLEGTLDALTPTQQKNLELRELQKESLLNGVPDKNNPYYGGPSKDNVKISEDVRAVLGTNFPNFLQNIVKNKFKIFRNIRIHTHVEDLDKTLPLNFDLAPKPKLQEEGEKQKDGDISRLEFIKSAQAQLRNDPEAQGRIVSIGNTDIILLKVPEAQIAAGSTVENVAAQGRAYLALAHELGHVVFNQEIDNVLDNKALRDRLYLAFEKDAAAEGAPRIYSEEHGFEEWYSDNLASFLLKEFKQERQKPKNAVEGFFVRMAKKLKAAWDTLSREVRRRFQINPTFDEYITEVVASYKKGIREPSRKKIPFIQVRNAQFVAEKIVPKFAEKYVGKNFANRVRRETTQFLSSDNQVSRIAKYITMPSANFLRSLGKENKTGDKLADIFETRSQTTDTKGLVQAKLLNTNSALNEIEAILGIDRKTGVTQEAIQVLLETEDNLVNDRDLPSEQSREIRSWLKDFYNKNKLSLIFKGEALENYFPRLLDLQKLDTSEGAQELANILLQYNPDLKAKAALGIAQELRKAIDPNDALMEGNQQNEDEGPTSFNLGLAKNRTKYFANVPTKALREAGFLRPPEVALRTYIANTVKRVEYNKRGGAKRVQFLLDQLPENQKEAAEKAVNANLGRTNAALGPISRFVNSWGLVSNILSLLAFSVFASLPDFAGPVLRSKSFNSIKNVTDVLSNKVNREEAAQLAKDIGVVSTDAISSMYVNAAELDYMSDNAKFISEKFFEYTGLNWYTQFTREFAAGMGKRFLVEHAKKAEKGNETSIRYLKELNLNAKEVNAWIKDNFDVKNHTKVKEGLGRFVEESIVRPDASQRPVWASDPRFALIWQLKSFFYAYGKNIIGGVSNEVKARAKAGQKIPNIAFPILLAASTLLPLSMLGLDLRERFKVGLDWLLPFTGPKNDSGIFDSSGKDYRKSLDMEPGEYVFEILDRSGVFGPFALAMPLFMQEKRYGDPFWVSPLGPSVEKGFDFLEGDLDFDDIIPIWSQL
jgi:hypothetical protein